MRLFKHKAKKPAFGPEDFLTAAEVDLLRPKVTKPRTITEEKRLAGKALLRDADFEDAVARAHAVLDGEDESSIVRTVSVAKVGRPADEQLAGRL